MAEVDVGKMSYADLVALRARLEAEIEGKRGEELKVLADGYVKKIQAAGFTVAEAVQALQPYAAPKRSGATSNPGSTVRPLYRDPANPENTWSGRGNAAKWLSEYEAQGRSREEFKVADA